MCIHIYIYIYVSELWLAPLPPMAMENTSIMVVGLYFPCGVWVGLVCGCDRISSADFGHEVVFRSNFHVRTSCITLCLSASHRLHNQKETWGGYHGLGRGGP